ncbi:MAG TPA: DUF1223 domain-containing protein [Polyangium sp.]|nr:DUF1223 domain-containing protein [Polyangium sp.]
MRSLYFALPILLSAGCSTRSSPVPPLEAADARRSVVIELFSSEGCSSCPSADIVLRDLARQGAHGAAEIIAIEEHVDYWNYLGWSDPFSSAAWTARQRAYAQAMGFRGVYTPQAVIDGQTDVIGSDKEGILEAIVEAAKRPKARVLLARDKDMMRVTISELPQPLVDADVFFTTTEEGLSTAVPRGENAGVTVVHAPIARTMEKLGTIRAGETTFVTAKTLPTIDEVKKTKTKAVVIVQASGKKSILGAAAIPFG